MSVSHMENFEDVRGGKYSDRKCGEIFRDIVEFGKRHQEIVGFVKREINNLAEENDRKDLIFTDLEIGEDFSSLENRQHFRRAAELKYQIFYASLGQIMDEQYPDEVSEAA